MTATLVAECDHIHRVAKWGLDESSNYKVDIWDCASCGTVLDNPRYRTDGEVYHDPSFCEDEACFACKIQTLQLSAGEASSSVARTGYTVKKWDSELDAYRNARAQGIQPKTTKLKDIRKAVDISNKTGTAFGSHY